MTTLPHPRRLLPLINAARCTGCGWCVARCPEHLLTLEVQRWRKTSTLHQPEVCTGCHQCAWRCPVGAIQMAPRPAAPPAPAEGQPGPG